MTVGLRRYHAITPYASGNPAIVIPGRMTDLFGATGLPRLANEAGVPVTGTDLECRECGFPFPESMSLDAVLIETGMR